MADVLRAHPEVAFFAVIGLGYLIGRLRLGRFPIGAVTGTLLAGVAVGQAGITVSGDVKQCFFLLFLFAVGFRTGPQFFRGLKRNGVQHATLAAIVATSGLAAAYLVCRLLGYDAGTAAGVLAGSLTNSPAIGTASDALARSGSTGLINHIAAAYAVTYLIGVVGAAWFLAYAAPRLMGVDLRESCRRYEREMRGAAVSAAPRRVEYRAYLVEPGSPMIGLRVRDLEELTAHDRLFVERLRRGNVLIDPDDRTIVERGDVLAVTGWREMLLMALDEQRLHLREMEDAPLLAIPEAIVDVVVTADEVDGRTLTDLAAHEATRAVYLRRLIRGGTEVPLFLTTELHRGDVVTLAGPSRRVAQAIALIGVPDRATDATDMVLVAFGIVAGALIGMPVVMVGRMQLGLSVSVGVLLGGITCGWLRSTYPRFFGRVPAPALWAFESVGLAGFVGIVGLHAGPGFVATLRTSGLTLPLAGLVTVIVPHLAGVLVGRWVFRMEPGVLLGVCAGAGTATPALAAIQEAAESSVPTLGYGLAYAVGNVLIALWGSLIVLLL